jgi:CBS domain containing-hemolysin-like protein
VSTAWTVVGSVALLAANAFFVAAEFALVAAKQHRLEQRAADGSRAARVALAGSRHLSLMLAGAQLGITLCTLGLGALAKPAVKELLAPALAAVGLPVGLAAGVAFALAVAVVGFLHVVVGEMAPKSWAISHPEDSAVLLARPFLWFTQLARPVLVSLNALANACLRLVKVTPQDELAQAHGPRELRMLIESSGRYGTLDTPQQQLLSAMLAIGSTTVAQVMTPAEQIVTIGTDADAREVERASRAAGRSRLVVVAPSTAMMVGIVHIRDAVRTTTEAVAATAADLMNPPFTLAAATPVATAVRLMRQHRAQLALVADPASGGHVGLVALEDLLEELIGEFDDETDPVPVAAGRVERSC